MMSKCGLMHVIDFSMKFHDKNMIYVNFMEACTNKNICNARKSAETIEKHLWIDKGVA